MTLPSALTRRPLYGVPLVFAFALALLCVFEGAAPLAQTTTGRARQRAASNRAPRRPVPRRARRRSPAADSSTATPKAPPVITIVGTSDRDPPPDVQQPPGEPTGAAFGERPKPQVVTGGILNGKAVSKPQPPYPPIARAARAQGTVTVQVIVDEEGKVISASAISGHPLLQQAAVQAARGARFTPTHLSGRPVRVSGVITYNFVLQ